MYLHLIDREVNHDYLFFLNFKLILRSQKIAANEPEKKIPSIPFKKINIINYLHANASKRSPNVAVSDWIHLRAQSPFFLIPFILKKKFDLLGIVSIELSSIVRSSMSLTNVFKNIP